MVTIEDYGCEEQNRYYTEFKFKNDSFSILYSDGRKLSYVELEKKNFYRFYDSLLLFAPFELKDNYEYDEWQSTADDSGIMKIVLNDTISKRIIFKNHN